MMFLLAFALIPTVAILLFLASGSRETRVVVTSPIGRPAGQILDFVGSLDRIPVWRRFPRWLPGPLRISVLSCWGDPDYSSLRPKEIRGGSAEIRIRHIEDCEYSFHSMPRRGMSYQSAFRIMSGNGTSQLQWEFRCRAGRVADVLGRPVVAASVRAGMARSLEHIRRCVLSRESLPSKRPAYLARTDQLPAA